MMSAHFARPKRHDALDRLVDRRLYRELAYVDGQWTAGETGRSFEVARPGQRRQRRLGCLARRRPDRQGH